MHSRKGRNLDLLSLIEVREPYYALNQLALTNGGHVSARVYAEQPRGYELGALAAAEAGRHLAIAGSCACASVQSKSGKHFYLANRAHLKRQSTPRTYEMDGLQVEANAVRLDTREAQAACTLRDGNGHSLYTLDVTYAVMQERVFQRLFSAHRRDLRGDERDHSEVADSFTHLRRNPYLQPFPLTPLRVDREHAVAQLDDLPADLCAGHFPMYPAMPVALLMYGLSSLSGEVLRARYGDQTYYYVQEATVAAETLAFAGQSLQFQARWLGSVGSDDMFEAHAVLEGGTRVGSMQLTLRRAQ